MPATSMPRLVIPSPSRERRGEEERDEYGKQGEGRDEDEDEDEEDEEEDEFFEATEEVYSCSPRVMETARSLAESDSSHSARRTRSPQKTEALDDKGGSRSKGAQKQSNSDTTKFENSKLDGMASMTKDSLRQALSDGRLSPHSISEKDMPSPDSEREFVSDAHKSGTISKDSKPQHLRIVNLDTGEEFTLARGGTVGENTSSASVSSPLPNIKNSKTGEMCTLEEFEKSLGLSPLTREMERRGQGGTSKNDDDDDDTIDDSDDEDEENAQHDKRGREEKELGKTKPRNPGRWLKKRVAERFGVRGDPKKDSTDRSQGESGLETDAVHSAAQKNSNVGRGTVASSRNVVSDITGDSGRHSSHGTATISGRVAGIGQDVKVSVHRKIYKEFTRLKFSQEMKGHVGAVWCMKFSHCGSFLASAGQDTTVRVWKLLPEYIEEEDASDQYQSREPATRDESSHSRGSSSTSSQKSKTASQKGSGETDEKNRKTDDNSKQSESGVKVSKSEGSQKSHAFQYFENEAFHTYVGHKADVLDLCWSKSQFLLSSSMDKSVRLWHISMDGCLRVFNHNDFVTAIDFNPADDKYFLSGSLDEKLRIWNIPEHSIADWVNVHEMITSACYSSDGKQAIVGSYRGKCRFYNAESSRLEYVTQIEVRNTRGKNSKGRKITGLQKMPQDPKKLLITSNDSRIRIFDGYNLRCKYKGLKNSNSQIRASFNASGDFIVCGSEDGCVYIWSTINTYIPAVNPSYTGFRRDKQPAFESFEAHDDIVTVAIFVPRLRRKMKTVEVKPTKAAAMLHIESLRTSDSVATAEGEVAIASAAGVGQMIVTTGYGGEIKLWENLGAPMWL